MFSRLLSYHSRVSPTEAATVSARLNASVNRGKRANGAIHLCTASGLGIRVPQPLRSTR